MPVMHFLVRLPDDTELDCYSPSLVVKEYLQPGRDYALEDFMQRCREALHIASERVRARYGFTCSAAMDQLQELETRAARFSGVPDAQVSVLRFRE